MTNEMMWKTWQFQMLLTLSLNHIQESTNQSSAGWKTLSAIFKHAIVTKNDTKLVATLTSQPWTFTLVQFQVSHPITEEFLTFLHNWLTLLKITVKKNQEESRRQLSRYSLVNRTMVMLRRNLKGNGDQKEMVQKSVAIVKEILTDSTVTRRTKYWLHLIKNMLLKKLQ